MVLNSIKNNMTKEDIISDIILSIGADISGENVYVLVEGEADINFLNPYLSNNVMIYESYDGKNGVEYIVGDFFCDNDAVIGVRDRDYQLNPCSQKIFYYDYGSMEMMLIHNDEVYNSICSEYYRGDLSRDELRQYIFNQLRLLSFVRLRNERELLGISFSGLHISKAWKKECAGIDNDEILKILNKQNGGLLDEKLIKELKDNLPNWENTDFYFYTQGHDFFTLFAHICNQYKKRGVKNIDVEASARCAFRWDDMKKTSLCNQIIYYANSKDLKIICENA